MGVIIIIAIVVGIWWYRDKKKSDASNAVYQAALKDRENAELRDKVASYEAEEKIKNFPSVSWNTWAGSPNKLMGEGIAISVTVIEMDRLSPAVEKAFGDNFRGWMVVVGDGRTEQEAKHAAFMIFSEDLFNTQRFSEGDSIVVRGLSLGRFSEYFGEEVDKGVRDLPILIGLSYDVIPD